MNLSFAVNGDNDRGGKRVDGFDTDAVETSWDLITGFVIEFSTGVKNGVNRLDSGKFGSGVDIARDTAAIIFDSRSVDRILFCSR